MRLLPPRAGTSASSSSLPTPTTPEVRAAVCELCRHAHEHTRRLARSTRTQTFPGSHAHARTCAGTTTVYSSKSGAPVASTETKAKPSGFVVDDRLPKLDAPAKKEEETVEVTASEDEDEGDAVESKSAAKKKAKAKKAKKGKK
jgi:hypothetical protein